MLLVAGANRLGVILFCLGVLKSIKRRILKLIVVDPRKTDTCALADMYLQILPGTDAILFNAMARWMIEKKRINIPFIKKHTSNFDACRQKAFELTLKKAAEKCGITVDEIKKAAKMITDAKGFISMWTMGLNQSVMGSTKICLNYRF